ncbi:MAG: hypothetical protein C0481_18540 [Phenylobacterium sp.]|uniref:hypothetical protein n=1 Tax=Phenylobacterium sp. TaxID=1871053 RepID=UPI0025D18AD9|nr:hypothetical protein [Phenylobacterium sp.]MBA4013865.1 hypothetical protein [Phenylobacterium sp.]
MIDSADEFQRLRTSDDLDEQRRAALDAASEETWIEVIERFPDMREWVAINKTVPLKILRVLAADANVRVRFAVAAKLKLDRELFEKLVRDPDESVRARVAYNPRVPSDLLALLTHDPEKFVAAASRERALRDEGR